MIISISKHGLDVRANIAMLGITIFLFMISSAYWAISVFALVIKIISDGQSQKGVNIRQMFNAIVLISVRLFIPLKLMLETCSRKSPSQYCFADGVIVWRMRLLCAPGFSKRLLAVPVVSLILTASESVR